MKLTRYSVSDILIGELFQLQVYAQFFIGGEGVLIHKHNDIQSLTKVFFL